MQNTHGNGNDYVYDNIGNVTQSVPKSINSLTYDPFVNRTKTITMSSGNNMNFSYDGTERRVYKKDVVGSTTTEILYLHDGMNAIVERNKTGTPTEYIYGPTGIIAIKTTTSMHYVLKDHLGSTRVLVNTTDQPYALTTYDYSAFGTILTTPSSSEYLYTGQEWDQTSGLHNFKARMYDSDLMRFYGGDPAEQFTSPYSYVGNNSILYTDPSGEIVPFLAVVGIYTAIHVGVDAAQGRIDSWKDLGISAATGAVSGALAYSGFAGATPQAWQATTALDVAAAAGSAELSSRLPSKSFGSGPAGLTISPTFGFGSEGTSFGMDWSFSAGAGNGVVGISRGFSVTSGSSMANGLNGGFVRDGVFGGYAGKHSSLMLSSGRYANGSDADFNQTINTVRVTNGNFSLGFANDSWLGGGSDKGRTASVEIGWGSRIMGFNTYTSRGGEAIQDETAWNDTFWSKMGLLGPNPKGAYNNATVYGSAFYVGYRNHEQVYRAGINSPWVQDVIQNGWHRAPWVKAPYFPRGNYRTPFYGHFGTYNPFVY